MPLVLYNSLTRRKVPFVPIDPNNVRMYVCGPTVYDLAHIGNARAVVAFDLLYRVLRHEYGAEHVRYVRNITDIDDKIIDAARANGEPIDALTARTADIFHKDMEALGNLPPNDEPRATAHVGEMKALIERLILTQHAYEAEGHVLFSVASWPRYGQLSRRSRQEMIAGARVEVAPYKRDPGDFVLWKPSSPDQEGWPSPWGYGRPGWHIECSAMSEKYLDQHFDIHGGGLDLIFPHHENELAQSEAAHEGRKFVNFWVHNGFVTVGGAKMAKSEGNFVTVEDALAKAPPEIIRLALLMTHYRDPLDWTDDRLREAETTHGRFYRALAHGGFALGDRPLEANDAVFPLLEALRDDLNVPQALATMHGLTNAIYKTSNTAELTMLKRALKYGGSVMGLLGRRDLSNWLNPTDPRDGQILERIRARTAARGERRFADADRIRDELAAEGIILEDKPDGTTEWRRA